MTDENKLIDEVLYGLKVPPKQTRQQRKSMKRSEKNIKRNLYDDVLKPLGKSGGGLNEGLKSLKASEKPTKPSKKPSEIQATPPTKPRKKQAPKSKKASDIPLKKLTGGQAKIDMNKNNKIDAQDFKMLRGKALGGSAFRQMTKDMIARAFPQTVGQKEKEQQMYMEQKAKYEEPQKLSQGGGIAIKGTKFKGVF